MGVTIIPLNATSIETPFNKYKKNITQRRQSAKIPIILQKMAALEKYFGSIYFILVIIYNQLDKKE